MTNDIAISQNPVRRYFTKKGVTLSPKVYFIDVMSKMMLGLFATLLMSSIFGTLNDLFFGTADTTSFLAIIENYSRLAAGPAIGVAIAVALKAPPLVMFSAAGVGYMSYAYTVALPWVENSPNVAAGPLGAFFAVLIAVEIGKLVAGITKVDILVTPITTLLAGVGITLSVGWLCSVIIYYIGQFVNIFVDWNPLISGIIIAVVVGVVLTLPISSAALCAMIGIGGLAGGAAVVGCCAQMIGFAVISYRENKVGGLVAQGIGTSMLQMPNIMRHPLIWIPPTVASAVVGGLSTTVFKLQCVGISAGMGTCGFVGPIGIFSAMAVPITDAVTGEIITPAINSASDPKMWLGIVLLCFVVPAAVSLLVSELMRKFGLIKRGDMKLEL
jgi:uncharacterized membrane protein